MKKVEIISWTFGLLFLYTAINKLMANDKFSITIGQSTMLADYAGFLAWAVPALEILITLMLVFERTRPQGLYAAFALMVIFTTYITIILNSDETIHCACGGAIEWLGWRWHLVLNIFFVLLALVAIKLSDRRKST